MPDISVVATAISTTGALLGALGGVALSSWTTVRRDQAQLRRDEAQFHRQRDDQRAEARRQAHLDLLGTANQLKTDIEFAGVQHWTDMNVKLDTIQQRAVSASLHASRVALLSADTAEVALQLGSAASRLAATTARNTVMGGDQNQQFLGGQITQKIDLTEFDECIQRFSRAAAPDSGA